MMLTGDKTYVNEVSDDVECYKLVLSGKLKRFPFKFWTKPWSIQSANAIIRYLIIDKLNLGHEDVIQLPLNKFFTSYKLGGMLVTIFKGVVFDALESAFPNEYKIWEFRYMDNSLWGSDEVIAEAMQWLVEKKLGNSRERVCSELYPELMHKHGLGIPEQKYGVFKCLDLAYPDEYKPWELLSLDGSFWYNEYNIIKAIRWVVEDKLGGSRKRVCAEFNIDLLISLKLSTLLTFPHLNSAYALLNLAYPGEYNPWELGDRPKGYWHTHLNIARAVRFLVEGKLGGSRERVCKEFNYKFLNDNGLSVLSNLDLHSLLNTAYPDEYCADDFKHVSSMRKFKESIFA